MADKVIFNGKELAELAEVQIVNGQELKAYSCFVTDSEAEKVYTGLKFGIFTVDVKKAGKRLDTTVTASDKVIYRHVGMMTALKCMGALTNKKWQTYDNYWKKYRSNIVQLVREVAGDFKLDDLAATAETTATGKKK